MRIIFHLLKITLLFNLQMLIYSTPYNFVIDHFPAFTYSKNHFDFEKNDLITSLSKNFQNDPKVFKISFDESHNRLWHSELPVFEKGYVRRGVRFLSEDNIIKVTNLDHPFFKAYPDIGDFTLNLYFKPYSLTDGQILIKKWGQILDRNRDMMISQGFYAEIRRSKVVIHFENFFHFHKKHKSITFNDGKELKTGKWYRITVTYDSKTGELIKYLNGKTEEILYVTKTGKKDSTVFYPHFLKGNHLPIVIGENVLGVIDEVSINNKKVIPVPAEKYTSSDSVWTSRVFQVKSGSQLEKIQIDGSDLEHYVNIRVRFSENYFPEYSKQIHWHNVPENKNLSSYSDFPLISGKEFQYIQIQALLKNFDTSKPQKISQIHFILNHDDPPEPVEFVEAEPLNQAVRLSWQMSTETDIKGYIVSWKTKSTLQKSAGFQNQKIIYPGQTFLKNKKLPWGGRLYVYEIDQLTNDVIYSFEVRAFDAQGPSEPGRPSKSVSVIPRRYPSSY